MSVWGDLGAVPLPELPPDPGADALLAMVPDPYREQASMMLRPMFGQIRAQIGDAQYAVFCADLKTASEQYLQGNRDPAREVFARYGMDLSMLEMMAGIS